MKDPGRTLRIVAYIAGGALAAILAAGLALALLFPAERIGALAAERAGEALDREVTVDGIRLRLFPLPAVALEGVTVSRWRQSEAAGDPAVAADPGSAVPLIQIERVDVRPRLLPLLTGNVIIHAIVVDRPRIAIEIEGDASPDLEEAREGAPGFFQDADFQIRSIRVRNGALTYHDTRTGTALRLDGLNQEVRLEGELQSGELARLRLTGGFDAASFDASLPEHLAAPIRDVRLAVEHDATLDIAGRNADIARLALTLQELHLEGAGTVTAWSDPAERRVALRLESGDVDAATLVASLPAEWRAWHREGESSPRALDATSGRVRVRADAAGRLGNGEVPDVNGTIALDGVALTLDGRTVLDGFGGELDFSLDSASTAGLDGRLFGEPLHAAFVARDLADPQLTGNLATRLSLDDVAALGLLPQGWAASGRVPVELAFSGEPLDPATLSVDGTIQPAGASLRAPDWTSPLVVQAGTIALGGRDIGGQGLSATMGESDVALDFSMSDWLGFALGDSLVSPHLAFDVHSNRFDADAVMPIDPSKPGYTELLFARLTGRQVGGRSAGEAAEAAGLRLPELPEITLDGFVRVDEVLRKGAAFQDVDVEIGGAGGALELRVADFRLFGGLVRVAGRLDPPTADGTVPLHVEYRVERSAAEAFLQRYTPFRGRIDGELLLDGSFDMRLDRNALPLASSFGGTGSLAIAGGRLVQWPLVSALGQQLGLPQLDTITFRDWSGSFAIDGARVLLQETALDAGELLARAAGWFDLGGQLEIGATLLLGQEWTQRVRGDVATALVSAVADEDGRVPVGAVFSGELLRPSVRLDLSAAGARVADRVREEAEAEARDLARRLAEEVAERAPAGTGDLLPLPGTGGAEEALDDARDRVRGAVTDRLRGIFGAPGAAAPQPDEPAAPADSSTDDAGQDEPAIPRVEIGDDAEAISPAP